ncbi:MAG: hypothetical protein H6818_09530 [Phycisphaerales bacterium]|nr:hypothetical protein [Phycisphaerales bacterium]MCB9864106.1 hypothetical protein [Phycisphaerales bacterium]
MSLKFVWIFPSGCHEAELQMGVGLVWGVDCRAVLNSSDKSPSRREFALVVEKNACANSRKVSQSVANARKFQLARPEFVVGLSLFFCAA